MTISDLPFVAAIAFVASAISLLVVMGIVQAKFILRIRKVEPTLWEQLGRPSALVGLSSNRWTADARVNGFFYNHDFSMISDASTRLMARRTYFVRRFFLCYTIGVGSVIGLFMLLSRWHVI
jgi:hypothetical protein